MTGQKTQVHVAGEMSQPQSTKTMNLAGEVTRKVRLTAKTKVGQATCRIIAPQKMNELGQVTLKIQATRKIQVTREMVPQ